MARTPLFRYLESRLRLARLAARTGEPPEELAERLREARRLDRRELLFTAALAGAGVALGASAAQRPRKGGREVAIFGGGVAGLTAAYRLSQKRVPVRVYEAQQRVGGRMFSQRGTFADDHVVELGGELIDTGHTRIQKLARELRLTLDDFEDDDPAMSSDLWFFGGRRIPDAEVLRAFAPVAAAVDAARTAIGADWVTRAEPAGGAPFDRQSLAAWLAGVEMEGWLRDLLDVAYVTEYGLETAEQSALNFLLMIGTDPEDFAIFGESDERFHIRGGNDQIPSRLAGHLTGQIERGAVLEAISLAADGSYRCAVRRGGSSSDVLADHVILALPFTLLREVDLDLPLPPVKERAIRELGYGTNAKLMVEFKERLWRTKGRSNGSIATDLPFQLSWETTRLVPGASGILVNFTGGERGVASGAGEPAAHAEAFADDLERIFPGIAALRTKEVRFHWPTNPWVRGSYACYKPGQYTAFGGDEGTPVGNLFFAGEHTSSEAQGYMEGGVESGERAAREVLRAR